MYGTRCDDGDGFASDGPRQFPRDLDRMPETCGTLISFVGLRWIGWKIWLGSRTKPINPNKERYSPMTYSELSSQATSSGVGHKDFDSERGWTGLLKKDVCTRHSSLIVSRCPVLPSLSPASTYRNHRNSCASKK